MLYIIQKRLELMNRKQQKAMFAKKRSVSNPEIDRKKIYAEMNVDIPFVGGIRVGAEYEKLRLQKTKMNKDNADKDDAIRRFISTV